VSTTTTNLELVKPAGNERVDVDVINSNYDKIDEFAGLAITDANYVHTDNNYTTTEKNKLSAIQPNATATSFTQTLVSGTAVGTITINGTPYTIYAPASSGGASALNDLTDVTLANPSNGQVLKYNATTGKWENADESGGGGGYIPTGEVYTFFTDGSSAAANYTLYVQWTDGETVTTAVIVEYAQIIAGWTTGDYQNVTINWDRNNACFNFVAKTGSFENGGTYYDEGDTMGTLTSGNITFNAVEKEATGVEWTQIQSSGTKIAEIEIDGVPQNVYAPTPPTKTSDLTNDSNFVADASYVHTDNNYTTTEKNKLSGLVGVEANPSGTASTDLTKIAIGGTNYNIPSGGSGTTVIPNPQGTPTGELNTIQIGNDIYEIPTSSDEGGYLTADGNCYSTLPVYSDENDILKIQFKFWSSDAAADNQTIIGSSFAGNSDYLLYMTVENGEPIYSYAVANDYTYIKAPRSTEDYDYIELGYDYMIVNGTTYTSQTPAKHSVHRPICVFGSNYRGSGTIGEIKIYKNDVLTYDLVPSQWKGNVGRFIDVLNDDTPYPSEGTSDYGYIGTSSGTTVIANPEGEATDTLTKIQIGNDIYEIVGGGSGDSGFERTQLYVASETETVVSLSQSIADFDMVELVSWYTYNGVDYTENAIYSARDMENAIGTAKAFGVYNDAWFTYYRVNDVDELECIANNNSWYVKEIYGLKFNGGGSAEWTDVVGTLEAGQTQIVLTSSKIKANSVVNPYASKVGVKATNMVIAKGSVTLTFPVQTENLDVMVRVTKVNTNHTYDIDLSHLQTDKSWFYYDDAVSSVNDTGDGLQISGNDTRIDWTTLGAIGINISNMVGAIPSTLSALKLHFNTFRMSGYTGVRFINSDTLYSGSTGGGDGFLRIPGFYQFENNNSTVEEEDYTLEIPCTPSNLTNTYLYIMFFDGMITGNMSYYDNGLNGSYNVAIDGIDFVTGGDS